MAEISDIGFWVQFIWSMLCKFKIIKKKTIINLNCFVFVVFIPLF